MEDVEQIVGHRDPTTDDIDHLASHMRKADIDECRAASGRSPLEAVVASVEASEEAHTLLLRGEVAAIWGVVRIDEFTGLVWMLTTDAVEKHRDAFDWAGQLVLPVLLTRWDRLVNAIKDDNTRALRWGERVGFRFGDRFTFGPEGATFVHFSVTKEDLRV